MNRKSLVTSLVIILVIVAGIVASIVAGARPQLGLDLQGGISAIYSPRFEEGEPPPDDLEAVLDETIAIIRQRVDSLGVAEPDISRQGTDVLVQLPGLQDAEQAREVIGTTAQLTFRPVVAVLTPFDPRYYETPSCIEQTEGGRWVLADDRPKPAAEEAGVVCGPVQDEEPVVTPSDQPSVEVSTPAGTESETAEPAPTQTEPTPTESASPAGAPAGAPQVVAAQDASPSEAPSVAESTAASEAASEPASEAPSEQPSEPIDPAELFQDDLPVDAPRPLKYQVEAAPLTGDNIVDAFPALSQSGGWDVSLELDGPGGTAFAEVTNELACRRDQGDQNALLAIVLDDVVESAPTMSPGVACGVGIAGGQASISVGGGTADEQKAEADSLALVLRTGALPITLQPSTFETVSPTLGSESLRSGLLAGLVGLILVAIYLVFWYRLLGVVAIGALAIFGVLVYGVTVALGAAGFALTLAGIAGVIVSVGIAADSSILFFERIRDEIDLGKTVRTSVTRAFSSAFRTNLAGNTVTLAAALILYLLAVGPVRGFALMLGISTLLDIVILWVFTRSVVGLLAGAKRLSPRAVGAPTVQGGVK